MNPRDAIIICTERNFEWKSRLLVRSIRAFGGNFSDIRIVSYSPCPDGLPSRECLDELRSLDVEVIASPLNVAWLEYRLANKVVACAHAEQSLGLDRIAFIDSDQIIVSNFPALFESAIAFAGRPVDVRNIGVSDSAPEETHYWDRLYDICGVRRRRNVETAVCHSHIREYFDSGMFSVNAESGLLTAWKHNFNLVWLAGVRPTHGDYFVEQSCLSATVTAEVNEVLILPPGYNFPLDRFFQQYAAGERVSVQNPVSLHYHGLFDEPESFQDILAFAATFLNQSQCSWIAENVNELRARKSVRSGKNSHISLRRTPVEHRKSPRSVWG